MATPIKYFNPEIKKAYKDIEEVANKAPGDAPQRATDYDHILIEKKRTRVHAFVRRQTSYVLTCKCLEELKAGNGEFEKDKNSIEDKSMMNIHEMPTL